MSAIKKNILCPVDFSGNSDAALQYGIQLAVASQGAIHLVHVMPRPNSYDWMTGMYMILTEDTFKKARKEATEKLSLLEDELKAKYPSITITTVVDDSDDPADGILKEAKQNSTDLIIVGSHGRKGLDRLLMGSVAESILRHALCDVIIYKKGIA